MSKTTKITAQKNTNSFNNRGLSFARGSFIAAVLGLSVLGVVGCSGGGDSAPAEEPVVDAKPTGYYTGSADVKDAAGNPQRLDDLQAMINGNRFMVMSAAGVTGATGSIIYDGTITDINGNDFTADVTIYVTDSAGDNIAVSTTTVSGTITEGSQITGTFAGTDAWSGSFSLVYAQNNSEASSISKIDTSPDKYWIGEITSGSNLLFTVDNLGNAVHLDSPGGGIFGGCSVTNSTILPIINTNLYTASFEFSGCSVNSINGKTYIGLATTKGADDILVLVFTGNDLAVAADYKLLTL